MLLNKISYKISSIKVLKEDIKIIYLYRYFSLIITSLFYLIGGYHSSIQYKLIVVSCLSISSVILNYLYIKNHEMKNIIKILITIEMVGNAILLIPTGGLNSPYIWYSLNTVLISIYFLSTYYCYFNLLIYLIVSSAISFMIFDKGRKNVIELLVDNSNVLLSFILVTVGAQLLISLTKKLKKESTDLNLVNNELMLCNERIKKSMEEIMSLYQAVHCVINQNDKNKLVNIIVYYTKEITKSKLTFFCIKSSEEQWNVEVNGEACESFKYELVKKLEHQWGSIKNNNNIVNIYINNKKYMCISVNYLTKEWGILGIEINDDEDIFYKENIDQLRFLSELSSIVFERLELEEANKHLLIAEEQNRIANEIHDSVSQRLFSISCGIYTLKNKLDNISFQELKNELGVINDSTNKVMKELRATIYGLSSRKRGVNVFQTEIRNYVDEVSKLNGVDISFNMRGNQELMCCNLKKALYRVICEGMGNALNHGKCSHIEITINVKDKYTELEIIDNGIGFNLKNKMDNKDMGLGIRNMFNLVYSLNGRININSELKKGTTIAILLPNHIEIDKEQGEVV